MWGGVGWGGGPVIQKKNSGFCLSIVVTLAWQKGGGDAREGCMGWVEVGVAWFVFF